MRPNERGSLELRSKLSTAAWSAIGPPLDPSVRPDEESHWDRSLPDGGRQRISGGQRSWAIRHPRSDTTRAAHPAHPARFRTVEKRSTLLPVDPLVLSDQGKKWVAAVGGRI